MTALGNPGQRPFSSTKPRSRIDPDDLKILLGAGHRTHVTRHALTRNTRPGSCAIPMEPGTLCDRELP